MQHHTLFTSRRFTQLLLAAIVATTGWQGAAQAQSSATSEVGAWECLHNWSGVLGASNHQVDEIAHAALLPVGLNAGKVLFWNYQVVGQTSRTYLFDPLVADCAASGLSELPQQFPSNIFCSGHTFFPDGSLIVTGGIPAPDTDPAQHRRTYRFNPRSMTWTELALMAVPRYYPTSILLTRHPIETQGAQWQTAGSSVMTLGGPRNSVHYIWGQPIWETLAGPSAPWQSLIPTSIDVLCPPWLLWSAYPGHGYQLIDTTCEDVALDSYPRALQLSSGDVFVAGDVDTDADENGGQGFSPGGRTWYIRPPYRAQSGEWEYHDGPWMGALGSLDPADRHKRTYAPAVLLHEKNRKDRVLVFGGANEDPTPWSPSATLMQTTATVEELTTVSAPEEPVGTWHPKANMVHQRLFSNAVVLPTGKVLITGGVELVATEQQTFASVPVHAPEIYDPGLDHSVPGASLLAATPPTHAGMSGPIQRTYHHVSLLLPDGRVLVAGGTDSHGPPTSKHNADIYSPPYLFQGTRPSIGDMPSQVSLSDDASQVHFQVNVTTALEDELDRIVLLRPASVTHHFDADQRYIELEHTVTSIGFSQSHDPLNPTAPPTYSKEYVLSVTAPREELAPQGWYMLFALSQKPNPEHRVPSFGQFVRFH